MNFLKATGRSTRFVQRRGLGSITNTQQQLRRQRPFQQKVRLYSTPTTRNGQQDSGSNIPWAIGSLLVFGPILFKLTSPPPPKKKNTEEYHLTSQHGSATADAQDKSFEAEATDKEIQEENQSVVVSEEKKAQKPYVLVGAGTASFAAAQAIKEKDPEANVIIIGDEAYSPYMRPPLSKELWFSEDPEVSERLVFKDWSGKERNTLYQDISQYEVIEDASGSDKKPNNKIKLLLNKSVTKLDVEDHTVTLNDGSMIYYNKVLLATGGQPKTLPNQPATENPQITTFRNISDFKKLDKIAKDGAHIAVIGGGFLGSELAVALAHRSGKENLKVTQIFPESGNMAKVFPGYLTKWTTSRVRKLGVDVKEKCSVETISSNDGKSSIKLNNGETLDVDHIIVAIGIEPRIDLARDAGLEIDEKRSGVVVNAELEARRDVYAAGDMVSFHDVQLGRRRIEHHDHAVLSGRHAGENMVGGNRAYNHQSMFWSDLGPEVGYEAVGLIDSQLSTVSVWAKATKEDTPAAAASTEVDSPRAAPGEEGTTNVTASASAVGVTEATGKAKDTLFKDEKFGKGLVFYTRDQKIVGLVLFNVFGKVQEARDIINKGYTTDQIDSLVKKFDIYSKDH